MMVSRRDRNFGGLFPRGYRGFDGFGFWFFYGGEIITQSYTVSFAKSLCAGAGGERLAAAGKLRWPFM